MPRFYLEFSDGKSVVTDTEEMTFLSEDEAISTGVIGLQRAVAARVELRATIYHSMSVRNEHGHVIFETGMTARLKPLH